MKIAAFYENIVTAVENEGKTLEEVLKTLMECGLEMVYISGDSVKRDGEIVLPLFEKLGIDIEGIHQHFDFAHKPDDESFKEYVDMTAELKAGSLLLVPGFVLPGEEDRKDEIMKNMLGCVERAIAYAKEKNVKICMEDFDHMISPINSVAGLDYFFDRLPDLYCAFDSGNFCCYKEDEVEAYKHFRSRMVTMHVKDRGPEKNSEGDNACTCADGSLAWSVPLGTGYIRIAEIIEDLKKTGYEGNVIAELYGYEDAYNGLQTSVKYLKKLIG